METYKGYVERIIYQKKENGYIVFELTCEDDDYTCQGVCSSLESGDHVEVYGNIVDHPVYGVQIKFEKITILELEDSVSMERYLGSGAIKGVGPSLAARIVKKFGDKTFEVIERNPEKLVSIKGISERIAQSIWEQMEEKKGMRQAIIYLQKLGISNNMALKIYNFYGANMYGVIEENPYKLAEDISGIGFRIADEIAETLGIKVDSDYRIQGGVLYTLQQNMSEGNVYTPKEMLLNQSAELLGLAEEQIEPAIVNLVVDKKLVVKNESGETAVYFPPAYYGELACASLLWELQSYYLGINKANQNSDGISKKIEQIAASQKIQLDEIQLKAVKESLNNGVFILTGGPGTGKTTIINIILKLFESQGFDILLAAPTGRAAKRMEEATGFEAKTIHRLLEVGGGSVENRENASFNRNEENPLECDVLIVDEMSMVDEYLFKSLLKAILPGTTFIMVGDVNQLPSVGPGQVLRDVIDSECFPVVKLEKIYRQSDDSHIIYNAHRINKGENIKLDNKSTDFFFLERSNPNQIYQQIVSMITERLPKFVGCKPEDVQVLTPMRKGNLGVGVLNEILQKYVNPPATGKSEKNFANRIFRMGDKVMQTKNNYQLEWVIEAKNVVIDQGLGVFNGDIGVITDVNEKAELVVVKFDDGRTVKYSFSACDELEHAYAITVHKSQGSEYPAVIMPIVSGPTLLFNRNLLYTAVTRAKKCITIIGSSKKIEEMIENTTEAKRYTGLKLRILEVVNNY